MAQNQSTSQCDIMANLREEGVDTKALRDHTTLTVMDIISGIRRPPIPTDNFKIKSMIIQMIQANQFGGSQAEDPIAHITSFLEIYDTFKHNGDTDDFIRLRLFPFSLRDKAKI